MKSTPQGFWVNVISALLGIGICVYVWITSGHFPEDTFNLIDSAYFPRMLSGGLLMFSWLLLINTVVFRKPDVMEPISLRNPGTVKAALICVFTLVYILLLKKIGFIIMTTAYIYGVSVFIGNRKWLSLLVYTLLFTAAIYFLFKSLLGINLPPGLLKGII